jgi:hypothetical protein
MENPDDLPLDKLLGREAGRESIEVTNPEPVQSQAETFKALLREASSPR